MHKSASRLLKNAFCLSHGSNATFASRSTNVLNPSNPYVHWNVPQKDHNTSLVTPELALDQGHNETINSTPESQDALLGAVRPGITFNHDNPEAWLALLDPYLPDELRTISTYTPEANHKSPPTQPIHTLPSLLSESRKTTPLKLDLLSYLGAHEGKWDGVIWLVKRLLQRPDDDGCTKQSHPSPWEHEKVGSQSLEDICRGPIRLEDQNESYQDVKSLDQTTKQSSPSFLHGNLGGLGQIWASVASMILQATDLPKDDQTSKTIMSHVLEILAHLHHSDMLPGAIYNFSHAKDPSVIRKPPTLYLLAYRIMTILSDSAWKAHDEEVRREAQSVGAKDWYKGHEITGPTLQPRVNMLGTEVWLDLVLWCCVEGGFITEAAWVVGEMAKRKGDLKWSAIDWSSLRNLSEPKLNWSARVELEIARSRMNQIASGIGIAGQSGSPPYVEMGHRTVSQEVILALMDALSNTISPLSVGYSPTMIVRSLGACRSILGRSSLGLEETMLDRSVLSIVESGMTDPQSTPGALQRILEMAPSYRTKPKMAGSAFQPYSAEFSAACIGLLHITLYHFSVQHNLQGALQSFVKVQSLVDALRRRCLYEFAETLRRGEREDGHGNALASESIKNLIPGVYSQIPVYILASLLKLITETGQYELGEWLLYSDEVDCPLIPQSLYAEEALQPALLRFAEATANGELFAKVSAKLTAPLSPGILKTLLQCQITLGKWEAAEEIFRHFESDTDMGLTAQDIMSVARAILRLDKTISEKVTNRELYVHSHSLDRACNLLRGILHGAYNQFRDPSSLRDYSDVRLLTQTGRILHSVPGSLAQIPLCTFGDVGRANALRHIPTEAFNILLEGVVEAHGSLEGHKMWELWSLPAGENKEYAPAAHSQLDDRELVVRPSLQTLRIIMRPMVKAGVVGNQQEARLVNWAMAMCERFGMTAKETSHELAGLSSQVREALEGETTQRKSELNVDRS